MVKQDKKNKSFLLTLLELSQVTTYRATKRDKRGCIAGVLEVRVGRCKVP